MPEQIELIYSDSYKAVKILIGIITLGVGFLVLWITERKVPRLLDAKGLTTNGGAQYAWSDLSDWRSISVVAPYSEQRVSSRCELNFSGKLIPLAPNMFINGQQAIEFVRLRVGTPIASG